MAERCPTPDKKRFATAEAAHAYALQRELALDTLLHPYACTCGWIHLTSLPQVPPRAEADPAIVNALRHASHDVFAEAVEADASGRADMPARIALRAPRIRGRWITTLRAINARLDREITDRPASPAWRQRAEVFRHHVQARLAEAERLRDRERAA
ncbi:hypothetical protein [Streptomyces sp. NPDC020983]|uniref:hypothetical protein n=1 Tax=Streptomyces sp. NPDC020983 TaxID=3365106 RepID=UPI0037A18EDE